MKPRKQIRIRFRSCPTARFTVPVRQAVTSHQFWRLLVELAMASRTRLRAGNSLNQLKSDRLPGEYEWKVPGQVPAPKPRLKQNLRGAKNLRRYGSLLKSHCGARRSRNRSLNQGRLTLQMAPRFDFQKNQTGLVNNPECRTDVAWPQSKTKAVRIPGSERP